MSLRNLHNPYNHYYSNQGKKHWKIPFNLKLSIYLSISVFTCIAIEKAQMDTLKTGNWEVKLSAFTSFI